MPFPLIRGAENAKKKRNFLANPNYFGTKYSSCSNQENEYTHLMFSFKNKEVLGV